MNNQNYSISFLVDQPPEVVFQAINRVDAWWSDDMYGQAREIGDRFTIRTADLHRFELEVQELVPERKVSWYVFDNYFSLALNKREWKDNRIVFAIEPAGEKTRVEFTHVGCTPAYECFEICVGAWGTHIKSLHTLITTGKPLVQSDPAPLSAKENSSVLMKGKELYAALRSGDAASLQSLLSSDFQGCLAAGLPHGLGRLYAGRDVMMSEAWGAVEELFHLDLRVERLIDADGILIGQGTYEGSAKGTGKELRASFAHFWQFDGHQFRSMKQITDTGLWRDALN